MSGIGENEKCRHIIYIYGHRAIVYEKWIGANCYFQAQDEEGNRFGAASAGWIALEMAKDFYEFPNQIVSKCPKCDGLIRHPYDTGVSCSCGQSFREDREGNLVNLGDFPFGVSLY